MVATLIDAFFLPIVDRRDFVALRVAATYPNIVSLPILIFPSLCEFSVVYEGYASGWSSSSGSPSDVDNDGGATTTSIEIDSATLRQECIAQSTTMIFCYFFAWSLAFWSFGNPQLMNASTTLSSTNATRGDAVDGNTTNNDDDDDDNATTTAPVIDQNDSASIDTSSSLTIDQHSKNDIRKSKDPPQQINGSLKALVNDDRYQSKEVTPTCSMNNLPPPLQGQRCESSRASSNDPAVDSDQMRDGDEPTTKRPQPSSNSSSDVDDVLHHQLESPSIIIGNNPASSSSSPVTVQFMASFRPILGSIWTAVRMTVTSPGFVAMMLAFITACIPPLQRALFEPGGALRFIGSALESLGTASAPISTMVVAASLVPPTPPLPMQDGNRNHGEEANDDERGIHHEGEEEEDYDDDNSPPIIDERPGMTDPNFGPYRRRRRRRPEKGQQRRRTIVGKLGRSIRSSSTRMIDAMPRSTPEMRRIHLWFNLSRLVVTPAVIVGIILALDCTGSTLAAVSDLAKLVMIVNASLPGALIIVVILKSREEWADTAAAVSRAYLPNYLLSIVTIAAWTGVGLYVTVPDEDGNRFCQA
jgi:predicted permease